MSIVVSNRTKNGYHKTMSLEYIGLHAQRFVKYNKFNGQHNSGDLTWSLMKKKKGG